MEKKIARRQRRPVAGRKTIPVLQIHCDIACKKDGVKNSNQCMIAQAIQDAIPVASRIVVDTQSIRWSDPNLGVRFQYFTPPEAQEAILRFDAGKPVHPFTLKLKQGVIRDPTTWAEQRSPGASRKGKTYRKTGVRRVVPVKRREFGLRALSVR